MMKAISVKEPGGSDQLQLTQQKKPQPSKGELLIEVHAAAVNRTDIVNRESENSYLEHHILGIEVAGIVVDQGEDTSLPIGTKVMGLVNGGGYAEFAVMPEERAIIVPEELSFTEAAAIPEVFLTAYQTLYWLGQLKKGETVLIHAGGSGVGTAAIQLAKQLTEATVITTAGTDEKLAHAKELGADICINYKRQNFAEEVLEVTNGQGADVILDFVGASYFEKNYESIATDGRWVLIGILGGATVENVNLFQLMLKRVQLIGTLLTPRSDEYKAKLTKEFEENVMPAFKNKLIKPIVDTTFRLENIREAHDYMEANQNIGKIIIEVKAD